MKFAPENILDFYNQANKSKLLKRNLYEGTHLSGLKKLF